MLNEWYFSDNSYCVVVKLSPLTFFYPESFVLKRFKISANAVLRHKVIEYFEQKVKMYNEIIDISEKRSVSYEDINNLKVKHLKYKNIVKGVKTKFNFKGYSNLPYIECLNTDELKQFQIANNLRKLGWHSEILFSEKLDSKLKVFWKENSWIHRDPYNNVVLYKPFVKDDFLPHMADFIKYTYPGLIDLLNMSLPGLEAIILSEKF